MAAVIMPKIVNQMLSSCEGPKLHPFFDRSSDIQLIRMLSDLEQEGYSHVFEVIINSRHYALKMVSLAILLLSGQS